MEIKAKHVIVDCAYHPIESLRTPINYHPCTVKLPGYNLIIGARYQLVELTGLRNGKYWKGTIKLEDAEVVAKDMLECRFVEVIESN